MFEEIIDGIIEAFRLLFSFDTELWKIIEVSFRVSLTSTIIALLIALPIGSFIGLRNFRGKNALTNLINTFMGFPPVVMGLFVYLLLSRTGPLGPLHLNQGLGFVLAAASTVFNLSSSLQSRAAPAHRSVTVGKPCRDSYLLCLWDCSCFSYCRMCGSVPVVCFLGLD